MELKGIFKDYKDTRDNIKHRGLYNFMMIVVYILSQIFLVGPILVIADNYNISSILAMLFSTVITILVFVVYSVLFGKHSLKNLGFSKINILKNYGFGVIFGFLAFTFCMLIGIILGLQTTRLTGNASSYLIMYLIGFVIQGMSEEVMLRGVIFPEISSKYGIVSGIIGNSVIFALLHGANPNFTFISFSFLNLIMFGIFASLTYYYTENLWLIGAFHSIWNFAQGNIYGVNVSGMNLSEVSILKTEFLKLPLITGGEFGTEGGLLGFVSLLLCIFVVYKLKNSFAKMNNLEVNYEN